MQAGQVPNCRTCASLSGQAPITPGPPIYEGRYWVIEHAYPVAHRGWLVIVLKRHAAALHELTDDEAAEIGALQVGAARALRECLGCEKEYVACFAEKPGFQHVHMHAIARPADLPAELRATGIFARLNPAPGEALPDSEILALSDSLRAAFGAAE